MGVDYTQVELPITEIYDFVLWNGDARYCTNHGELIQFNGHDYVPAPVSRSLIGYHTNLQVDKVTVNLGIVSVTMGDKLYTVPQVVAKDLWRNAQVTIRTYDFERDEFTTIFIGYVTGVPSYNRATLSLECASILDKLQDPFPKYLYQWNCNHTHYGKYCTLDKADFVLSGTTELGCSVFLIYSSLFLFVNHAEGYWLRGEITIDDQTRSIIDHKDGYIGLFTPLDDAPAYGVPFLAYPGCNRTSQDCINKFNNFENFFGFEYIPKPEYLYF
jgi:hypothetical protein